MKNSLILYLYAFLVGSTSTFLTSCQQTDDEVLPDRASSVQIHSVDVTSKQPEGNSSTGNHEDDQLDPSIFSSKVTVLFSNTVEVVNPFSDSGVHVSVSGGHVVIESMINGVEYVISGVSQQGSIKINSKHAFKLTLDQLQVTNPNGPAIQIQSEERAFLYLPATTDNRLFDGSNYTEASPGTLSTEGKLLISGTGKLTVGSSYGHAISAAEYIRLQEATVVITHAAKDGLNANDAVVIDNGNITIESTDDGIECEQGHIIINNGTISIQSKGKAITASYDIDQKFNPFVTINGGQISINSDDEGIESKSILTINQGQLSIKAKDDALNAGTFLYINGGSIYAHSTDNDGIDSNGPVTITGGTTFAIGGRNPEAGIDCDQSTFKITGGVVVGLGGSTSIPTGQVSSQPSVILGGASANELISIISTDGQEIVTFKSPVSFSTLLFSTPKLSLQKTYGIYTGGEVTSAEELLGLYTSGIYQNGNRTSSPSFTTSSMVTRIGGNTGPGGRP